MERFFSGSTAVARSARGHRTDEKKYEQMPSDVGCLPARMPKGKFLSTHRGEPMSSKPQFQLAASLPVVSPKRPVGEFYRNGSAPAKCMVGASSTPADWEP